MQDIQYGHINIKLESIIKEQDISISKLACRAEMQRTQLKTYMHNEIQRVDLDILARLCFVLECSIEDILEYVPPHSDVKKSMNKSK